MALELNLTKNTNDSIQGTLGKYYARVEYKGTIGLRDLASHMHHHNTAFPTGIHLECQGMSKSLTGTDSTDDPEGGDNTNSGGGLPGGGEGAEG